MSAKTQPGDSSDRFFNRELSWLAFNERVLEEALDGTNPLLERVRFATIVASNLDEFFMVRVAALKAAVSEGDTRPDPSGLTPGRQLSAITARVTVQLGRLTELVTADLMPALASAGIRIVDLAALDIPSRTAIGGILPVRGLARADAARHRRGTAVSDAVEPEPEPGVLALAHRD